VLSFISFVFSCRVATCFLLCPLFLAVVVIMLSSFYLLVLCRAMLCKLLSVAVFTFPGWHELLFIIVSVVGF
jgi:hypothetical protein